jgi:hypothetical protein
MLQWNANLGVCRQKRMQRCGARLLGSRANGKTHPFTRSFAATSLGHSQLPATAYLVGRRAGDYRCGKDRAIYNTVGPNNSAALNSNTGKDDTTTRDPDILLYYNGLFDALLLNDQRIPIQAMIAIRY